MFHRLWFFIGLLCGSLLVSGSVAPAQNAAGGRAKPKPAGKPGDVRATTVELILLSDGGLQSQQWRTALEPLEISVSIRRGQEGEKLETTEKVVGTFRKVTAVGKLERSGRITFADRAFELGEREKLKQWVNDLKTFGAQGTPDGKPLWGLSPEQFAAVYESLTEITKTDARDQPLEQAIRGLPLPPDYPVRWSEAAKKRLERTSDKPLARQSVEGFSVATALAVLLNDHGLGFQPRRTPSGSLELLIDVPDNPGDVWPVGWPLKLPRQKAAPQLFKLQQVFFEDLPLIEVLVKAAQSTEMSILIDYGELDRQSADWESIKVSYLPRQATWHTVAKDVLSKAKLTFDLWQDEAGRPFLYVTSIKSKRVAPK